MEALESIRLPSLEEVLSMPEERPARTREEALRVYLQKRLRRGGPRRGRRRGARPSSRKTPGGGSGSK